MSKAQAAGQAPQGRLVILDAKGVFLLGRNPHPLRPGGLAVTRPAQHYANYKAVKQVLAGGAPTQGIVYTPGGRVFFVCAPIKVDGEAAGVLGVNFSEDYLTKQLGVDESEFLALDFNGR
jgi:hypothetical protein